MSWTIVCDLTMDRFSGNRVLDNSPFHNHGTMIGAISSHDGYVSLNGPDAQIEIPVINDSLQGFAALKVQAFIRPRQITHRYNIVEGWMSFAFFIESDGCLSGTVFDGANWKGPHSRSAQVPMNEWSRVCFEYDGVSLAKLVLNNRVVGSSFEMSYKVAQPRQVITIGHWPRGDHRYTFQGDIGHIRIERRNQEDIWRDALEILYCRRKLTPLQLSARRELEFLLRKLPAKEQQEITKCMLQQLALLRKMLNRIRGDSPKEVAILRRFGDELRQAWCCSLDVGKAVEILKRLFRHLKKVYGGARSAEEMFEELVELSRMCAREGPHYKRMQELMLIIFPELRSSQEALKQLFKNA